MHSNRGKHHEYDGMSRPVMVVEAAGFTVVELLITLIVGATFMLSFYTLANANSLGLAQTQQQANAYGYGYHMLRYDTIGNNGYRSSAPCSSSNDLSTNASAAGTQVQNQSGNGGWPLPSPVATTLTVFYPEGCAVGAPMMFVRTVTWGPRNLSIKVSQYVM